MILKISQGNVYASNFTDLIELYQTAWKMHPKDGGNSEPWSFTSRALGVFEHSWLRYNNYSDKICRDHTYTIGTTLSKEKSLGTTLSQEYRNECSLNFENKFSFMMSWNFEVEESEDDRLVIINMPLPIHLTVSTSTLILFRKKIAYNQDFSRKSHWFPNSSRFHALVSLKKKKTKDEDFSKEAFQAHFIEFLRKGFALNLFKIFTPLYSLTKRMADFPHVFVMKVCHFMPCEGYEVIYQEWRIHIHWLPLKGRQEQRLIDL